MNPDKIVKIAGRPIAVIGCFGILNDAMIRRYFALACVVKGPCRGHIQKIKDEVRKSQA